VDYLKRFFRNELFAFRNPSMLTRFIMAVARRVLAPNELAAFSTFLDERQISRFHRHGLRAIRRQSLQRPDRINLGCGEHLKKGFVNVDMFPGGDLTLDLRRGLPFDSDCCDMIFSEHFFEHVEYPNTCTTLLRDCLRVLKPGGMLRFSVPDTEWPLVDYARGDDSSYFQACRDNPWWHPSDCTTRLEHINYHFRQRGQHHFAYDFETAHKLLTSVGFVDVRREEYDPQLDSEHRRIGSLILSARKPEGRTAVAHAEYNAEVSRVG
jgi:predicted SAM-dependent methyltransferase